MGNVFKDTTLDIWREASNRWDRSVHTLVDLVVRAIEKDEVSLLSRTRPENEGEIWFNLKRPLEHIPLRL